MGSNPILPEGSQIPADDDELGVHEDAISFVNKVRKRFEHDESVYKAFLDVLTSHVKMKECDQLSIRDVLEKVSQLFCNHEDLVEDFKRFLPVPEALDKDYNSEGKKSSVAGVSKKKKKPDRMDKLQIETERLKEKEFKSIQELDLSRCKRCSPSYWIFPEDYPIPQASNRTKLCSDVLNDRLVCIPSTLQDFSLKHKRPNEHGEVLFKCENEKYELDSAKKNVEELQGR
ncbi:hypothetical protein P3X46_006459 [Hevea brasiliensis]|nr:hypothetical protein P3X46_006459 [Hevea brasiliensis]